jgi:uncharacterized membrane protein
MANRLIKTMMVTTAFCIVLVMIRMQWSGSIRYAFLVWNLFLAWIPFILSVLISQLKKENKSILIQVLLFLVWLIFFPNSPYLLTDLFHLQQKNGIPLWFDLVVIMSFAWNGLLLGFASLFEIQRFLRSHFSSAKVDIFIMFLMILCSFGIYLGRFPRWNSWDVLNNPIALAADILQMLLHPANNTRMIGVTFFFSLFLIAAYWTLKELIRNFKTEQYE